MNAVDTNVLAYSVDGDGKTKRVRALQFLDMLSSETILPWQVVCELGSVLTQFARTGRTKADPAEVTSAFCLRFSVWMPTEDLVAKGLRLSAAHQLSYWDALLLAACIDAGVTTLYTEDLQSRPVIEGVKIINPFA
jgi:predicted nucleic acid-binding protein